MRVLFPMRVWLQHYITFKVINSETWIYWLNTCCLVYVLEPGHPIKFHPRIVYCYFLRLPMSHALVLRIFCHSEESKPRRCKWTRISRQKSFLEIQHGFQTRNAHVIFDGNFKIWCIHSQKLWIFVIIFYVLHT